MLGLFKTGFPKVNLGLSILIVLVAGYAVFSVWVIQKNNRDVNHLVQDVSPFLESLEEFNLLISESRMYTTNWVYLQVEESDKAALKNIHQKRFGDLKDRLTKQVRRIEMPEWESKIGSLLKDAEKLISIQQRIMIKLASFDDYENAERKLQAENIIEDEVIPFTMSIQEGLGDFLAMVKSYALGMKNGVIRFSNTLANVVVGISFVLLLFMVLGASYISRAIKKPLLKMKSIFSGMAQGELPEEMLSVSNDVVGEMSHSVNKMIGGFEQTAQFAAEIGKGNFSVWFDKLGPRDMLGDALISMRDSLKKYSETMETLVAERTKEVIEKNNKLELAYIQIRDSINYAKKIQEAVLPSQSLIKEAFPDSIIFYKPKDIVSGDFYWYAKVGGVYIIAAVDCTGHGVPGALMTVVGSSLLNQIVNIEKITSPARVLSLLDEKVRQTLKQHGDNSTQDGMDLALFCYDPAKNEITYSGAKRSLFLFRDKAFTEVKGNKYPIGSTQYGDEKYFTEEIVKVAKGDTVYIFSDGYKDQFGGIYGKKYMLRKFKELLLEIHSMKMEDQLLTLEKENETWTGLSEQTDDILVIGVRF